MTWNFILFCSRMEIWKRRKRRKRTQQADVFRQRGLSLSDRAGGNFQMFLRAKNHSSLTKSRWTLLPFHGGNGLDDSSRDCAWRVRVQTIRFFFFFLFSILSTQYNEHEGAQFLLLENSIRSTSSLRNCNATVPLTFRRRIFYANHLSRYYVR